ncbi:MAG TPA: hypothetical protein VIL86_17385 [Tepidisphaeraceae bacterium]|jgi:hypothetical protein
MSGDEIASLLEDAGYSYNAETGRYEVAAGTATEGETDHSSEFVADTLELPLDDLQRWEDERRAETQGAGDLPSAT